LVRRIDQVVMQHALSFAKQLADAGRSDIRVSINLSSAQLHDAETVSRFLWDVQALDLTPEQICIEVLESTFLDVRSSQAVRSVLEFAEAGFSIDLDDFGTGHTAISSLRKLPVARIKIDRSLISGVDRDAELHIIADAVIGLGRKLGLQVLAEGVETESERLAAEAMGCTCVQGYFFAKAMPADEAIEWASHRTVATLTA
jgi:EAL domain-containing protein (putative c-di-GMP-specific phosphodiesterase class I)